ncbi:NAD(P)/FAD-dependent oxidoreductase [Desulfosporosinus lacus]|uniref:Sarcosine oxidase subunit beta n=1 Tax=Desulfosporosinus lacus DSM 15449 TaxID=1121420 RepID=A0A1M5Z7M6_9FIRM|nr:FAD-binding oxidoreductase [Desulfosporosinus lacus]SHI20201.1 sarcosine oxidase subunit beta [Desulfosporosinus lacus DSM 15449]
MINDVKLAGVKLMHINSKELKPDIIIIGAGIIGLSIAYHILEADSRLSITILEKEKMLGMGSTGIGTGSIRHQFSSPLLRRLSLLSRDFFLNFESTFDTPIEYLEKGGLMLADNEVLWNQLQLTVEEAETDGIPMKLLEQEELLRNFPYLDRDRFQGGTFCPWDSYADPYAVLAAVYAAVRRKGADVHFGREATKIILDGERIKGVETKQGTIWSPLIVNAVGPHAAQLAATAGIMLPVQPFRRQVYVCTNPIDVPPKTPLITDLATGFYLHQEVSAKTVLLGGTDQYTWPGFEEGVDKSVAEDFFTAVMEAIPSTIDIKWLRTYTGICEQTPDFLPIIGEVPGLNGFILANGFSGHGFMHAPAAGLIAADLILKGRTERIDLNSFQPDRFDRFSLPES